MCVMAFRPVKRAVLTRLAKNLLHRRRGAGRETFTCTAGGVRFIAMADWEDDLRRWRDAGVIDVAAFDRIRAYEAQRSRSPRQGPTVTEALLYVGLAAFAVGGFTLGALLWEDLTTIARFISTA